MVLRFADVPDRGSTRRVCAPGRPRGLGHRGPRRRCSAHILRTRLEKRVSTEAASAQSQSLFSLLVRDFLGLDETR